jgi:hypothetical protein
LATLADVQREVVAEYRELGRRQLEARRQQLADQTGAVSPLRQGKRRPLTLHTELGLVKLTVDYGQAPTTPQWFCPQQRAWGLAPHQKITPGLAEKLCFTAVATTSFAQAAAVAACWGVAVDDAVIHQQVQRAGERAEQQAEVRREASATPAPAPQPAGSSDALVIMMDGWRLRQRGADWGLTPAGTAGDRVAWQECKSAVLYPLRHAAKTAGERGLLVEKFVVAQVGEPLEFGRQVQAEARRRGLGAAPQVLVVADGGVWIWNIVADRFATATGGLDFYHASQHLWDLAHTLHPENAAGARAWVEPLRHQLRHGGEGGVLQTLHDLPTWCAQRAQTVPLNVTKEINCLENHRAHLQYETRAAEGSPVGSGAMESLCGQLQGRCKRGGQFWTAPGRRRLMALEVARRNQDWHEVWQSN